MKSRAVLRYVQPSTDLVPHDCPACGIALTFSARKRPMVVICNVFRRETVVFDSATVDRFWSRVAVAGPDECWEWLSYKTTAGYGRFPISGSEEYAHRIAFLLEHGHLPEETRHTCDNRGCVNPAHLLDGTHLDNIKDMYARGRARPGEFQRSKTHCKHGHEFTEENTYLYERNGTTCRGCRKCRSENAARYRAKKRQMEVDFWVRTEHWHEQCYRDNGKPHGEVDTNVADLRTKTAI